MLELLLTGLTLGLAAGVSPGPLLTLLVSETVRYGRREGIKVSLAPLATDGPILVVAMFVLSRFPESGRALSVISVAGGLFLIWMGASSVRPRSVTFDQGAATPHSFRKALAVNLLNPHLYVFWITVGTPMTLAAADRSVGDAAAFVAGFYAAIGGSMIAIAVLVDRSRAFLAGRAYLWTIRILGVALMVFGLRLIWGGYRS